MKTFKEIDGWFDYEKTFSFLVSKIPDNGIFVECGAWLGKSSSYLCDIAQNRIKVFIVDSWKGSQSELNTTHKLALKEDIYEIFLSNMGDRNFIPLRMDSYDASLQFEDGSCDVVFIDMEHTYDAVKKDLEYWWPKVKGGGYIAGHDYTTYPGVKKAVDELFPNGIIRMNNSCWIARKD